MVSFFIFPLVQATRNCPEYGSLTFAMSSTIVCLREDALLYLHKAVVATGALRTSGADSTVSTCHVKQIKAKMHIQQDFPLIVFSLQEL